ncbi:MAG: hypothetical protein PHE17_18140 [Thiothrix sp.]|uniref:hypothetical protein n=1 Tax=Thiothrix sp. TaxID=1032 RepID=UPI002633DD5A|nr:hypothetical protein [Thiothrix sp.]MDD5394942.1 hypothetical protein [Thiothrix sp.]
MPPQLETMDYLRAAAPITRDISGIAQDTGAMAQAVIDPMVARHNNNYQNGVAYAQLKDAFGHLAGPANVDLDTLAPQKDEPSDKYSHRLGAQMPAIMDELAKSGMNPHALKRFLGQPGVTWEQVKGFIDRFSAQQAQTKIAGGMAPDMNADLQSGNMTLAQFNQKYGKNYTEEQFQKMQGIQEPSGQVEPLPTFGTDVKYGKPADTAAKIAQMKADDQPTGVGGYQPYTYQRAQDVVKQGNVPEEMQAGITTPIAQRQAAEAAQAPGATPLTVQAQAGQAGLPEAVAKPVVDTAEKQQTAGMTQQERDETARHNKAMEEIDRYKAQHPNIYGRMQQVDQRLYDRLTKLGTDIDPAATVRTAMGVSKLGFDRAERLQSLFYQFPNLDRRQTEELAIGLNSLLQGANQSAQEQVKALVPQTMWGNAKKIVEWVTNNPTGLDQQNFTKRMGETIEREKQTFIKQIQRNQYARIAKYADVEKGMPDEFKNVLESNGIDYDDFQKWKNEGHKPISAVVKSDAQTPEASEAKQNAENALIEKARGGNVKAQDYLKSQGIPW